jgi:D-alanyl-D-alanine dipeptidase
LVSAQLQSFTEHNCPAIADQRIIQIPIIECGEELIDLSQECHPRISVMNEQDLILAHECIDDIDQRSPSHTFVRKSVYDALIKMLDQLDRLAPHFGYESGELCIKLFEGLRDLETQKIVFDKCLHGIMQNNPSLSYEKAYQETCKWVSPYINNIPTHSTGAAIDIHLWNNKTQQFCPMGRFNSGAKTAPTFSTDEVITEEQIKHRFLFLIAATEAGLTNYVFEFWHYSLGDRYASYWNTLPNACYNSL